jgi:ABC-type nitrate/sulfonate/bicarbonate transport system permease component
VTALAFRGRRAPGWVRRHEAWVLGTVSVFAGLLLWELLSDAGYLDPLLFSSPTEVADTAWRLAGTGSLWNNLRVSFIEFAAGFIIGTVCGIAVGLFAGASERAARVLDPWVDILYIAPIVALIPIFILWFGVGMGFKIFLVILVTLFPIAISTREGARVSEAKLMDMVTSFGASRARVLRTVIVPGAIPYIFSGMRQAAGRAIVGVVVAELIASNEGVGFMISVGGSTFNTPQVMFGISILAFFGLGLSRLLALCERHFAKWRAED